MRSLLAFFAGTLPRLEVVAAIRQGVPDVVACALLPGQKSRGGFCRNGRRRPARGRPSRNR